MSLTFHFRQTPEELHEEIKNKATEIIKKHGYNDNQAHLAIEAKPPVEWNKGFAAEYILKHSFGENWREDIKVIFAGDDTTDEDIMNVSILLNCSMEYNLMSIFYLDTEGSRSLISSDQ